MHEGFATDDPFPLERMSEWQLDVFAIDIASQGWYMGPHDPFGYEDDDAAMQGHEATLSVVLQQLKNLRTAPGVPVWLRGWRWTEPMERAVAQALPTLGHLTLGVHELLTDDILGSVLEMGE